ncbi:6060_t:CDS:1 [Paraglomus occultum]|uniref:6060_t:CDS:1 n=1 Tax=Paraglomus occultum TaxID=144539 RepID=A0A9N9GQI2_9GLOM|nr:6060_t:CDS:1 [Paraglomus occultum]
MKTVIVPLVEQKFSGCNCFQPGHRFEAEWCLDLYGFLNRTEYAGKLSEINKIVQDHSLLSAKAKTYFTYAATGLCVFIIVVALLITFAAGTLDGIYNSAMVTTVLLFVLLLVIPIGRLIIDNMAKSRAAAFTQAVRVVLDKYNEENYPTANWRLAWRKVFTHYSIKSTGHTEHNLLNHHRLTTKTKGRSTPKYAEHAELIIEIHDGLSARTAHTITVNIKPDPPASKEMPPTKVSADSAINTTNGSD